MTFQFPLTFCEDDLHTIVQMGFGQTANWKTPIQSPSFNGNKAEKSHIIDMFIEHHFH